MIKLTQYSHGAGCGCKLSPAVLKQILGSQMNDLSDPNLLVGNQSSDDAAAYDMGDGKVILSTTDFFMPIVDDPFDFGRIAATNAISDIYAMGGKPLMAIAILGWPINKLGPEVAAQVLEGGRKACADAGCMLAGGHSIDSPEPIFGLAVTGQVSKQSLKRNDTATVGCELFLSKPLGIGLLTTAEKQGKLLDEHKGLATQIMCQSNRLGQYISDMAGIAAVTDVTGFGLLGHLIEMMQGSDLSASVKFSAVPTVSGAFDYIEKGCVPGGTERNFSAYGHHVSALTASQKALLCDPQTSGGLLIAAQKHAVEELRATAQRLSLSLTRIGEALPFDGHYRVQVHD
ncbi:selenide, water dikinase SelD [Aestuariibacter salexigens]|uniref:selenide, water dikinase SelD n=1 Tax=Aestuariibacter salexigens TaxID=226010 RepID=UPI000416C943|nr:selenide, water dikinase SelD [Aestuariibacter salexigens]